MGCKYQVSDARGFVPGTRIPACRGCYNPINPEDCMLNQFYETGEVKEPIRDNPFPFRVKDVPETQELIEA